MDDDLLQDALRFRFLMNLPQLVAQSLFWNFESRRQRRAEIDRLIAVDTLENTTKDAR